MIATDAAGNASEAQTVTLDINDLDDEAPTVTSGDTAVAIDENSGAGQVVYMATADDTADDVADTPMAFSLTEGSDAGLTIDSTTGAVTLAADPDHETQSQYSFAVIATDAAGNVSEAQSVTLDINDLDDAAPTVTSGATAVAIDENSGAGQVIYTATSTDVVDDVADTPIAYSLAEGSDAALSINSETGAVTLSTDPDHETQAQYNFAVIATDAAGNASEAQAVTLDINDLDEVAPTFNSSETIALPESTSFGAVVYKAVIDDSQDISAGISFDLSDDSDPEFVINSSTGEVTFNGLLDYGSQPSYGFTVIANDGVNQTEHDITVAVIDEDLEAPVFISLASAAADENVGDNQVIYTAISQDESLVEYSLSEDSDAALSINADTGQVTLGGNPDYETQNEYSFTVIATDSKDNISQQAVTVSIDNLDEIAPTITSGATAVGIDEDSGAGQVIYTVTADDSADVADTPIAYSLAVGSDAALSINVETGAVTLTANPDHETQSQYSFAVIATDAAGNASDAQSVTLDINDLDDVAPTITSGVTAVAIDENSGAGQVIYTVTSTDLGDDVADTPIAYSLAEGSDAALSIDASTGAVTLATDPNYEMQSQYSFAVIATDAAGNESAAQPVNLDINNLDEVAPTILSTGSVSVLESAGANASVYRALADDTADISAQVTFSLSEDSDAALTINSETGVVTLN